MGDMVPMSEQVIPECYVIGNPLPCGHHNSLAVVSSETGLLLYCELCDTKSSCADRAMEVKASEAKVAAIATRTTFSRLDNFDPATHCLRLLAAGEISVGKACEWLAAYFKSGEQQPITDFSQEYPPSFDDLEPISAYKRMCAAEAKVAEQAATIERLTMAMRDMEWCGLSDYCLLCGRTKKEGHNSVCRLDAALNKQVQP